MKFWQGKFDDWLSLRSWRPFFLILVIGFLLYGQTLSFGLTYLDDNTLIIDRYETLQDTNSLSSIFSTDAFFSGTNFYYRPLLNLSFLADTFLAGVNLSAYHLDNILLHILAAGLLFVFLERIIKKRSLAFFLTLVFLVHPALVQAVAWLPGRNDSLLAVFVLAAFLCLMDYSDRPKPLPLFAYSFFLLLALLTKETAILLPFLAIAYFIIKNRRHLSPADISLVALYSFSSGFIWLLLRKYAFVTENIGLSAAVWSVIDNIPNAFIMGAKLILPFRLSVLPVAADSSFVLAAIAWPLLIMAIILSRSKDWKNICFGSAWFLAFFIPPFMISSAAPYILEHRLYLPFIGFLVILAEIDWVKNLDFRRRLPRTVAIVILLLLSILSFRHSLYFHDQLSFWRAAVASSPHSPLAQKNLGAMYHLSGQPDQAIGYYRRALELNPEEQLAHNNLGLIYLEQGDYEAAEAELKSELALNPNYDKALFNLGDLYYRQDRRSEAERMFKEALRVNPYHYEAQERLNNLRKQLR